MLKDKKKLQAYRFEGYWRDVGTLASLHEANMDIALDKAGLDLYDEDDSNKIYTEDVYSVPQYVGKKGSIRSSIANQGAIILGDVESSVISSGALIESGAKLTRCVVMEGARIRSGAKIHNAIVAPYVDIEEGRQINLGSDEVVLVSK